MFATDNVDVITLAYRTYVLPILEYCSPVWCPSRATEIDMLEKVQRYFTRRLVRRACIPDLGYPARLGTLGFDSLEVRRLRNDLTMCYRIVHGDVDLNPGDFFQFVQRERRGHDLQFVTQPRSTNYLAHEFSTRIVPVWNSLQEETENTNWPFGKCLYCAVIQGSTSGC